MTPSDLYNRYKDEAKKYASNYGLDMTPREDGEWDAFRHAYASAVMTSEFSSLIANLAGLAVEFGGLLHGNSTASSNMDLWNNNIGRDIGAQTTSKDEIAQKVFDALKNGSLIVDLNDTRNYINDVVFDTSLDRFLFLESADLSEEDLTNLLNKYNSANPSDRATEWLNGEGLPWAYNPSTSLTSPLVLDLDGDGVISLVSLNQSKTLFDVTGDGMSELTGWIGANDGILVNDVNNNGTIDNITEMFGNQVKINGFVALADKMDTNQDGVVNAQDTNFTSLQVWQDINQDGISQNSELRSLSELGITEICSSSIPVTSSGDLIVLDETLFTCKIFNNQKTLHVKTNIEPKEANYDFRIRVA